MAEKRVSLVIGNSAYAHASTLANPHNDARGIAGALTRIGFAGVTQDRGVSRHATPILDVQYNDLRRLLAAFARAAEDAEQAVLYYAGHGIEVNGQNYLIPVDATLQHATDVEFETASLMQVLGTVEGATGLRLVILDACRDNPFRQRLFATRNLSRGLRAIEPTNNILVAYSAKHGTVALDGDGGNSPYTAAMIRHMEKPGLEIVDLFREIKDTVQEETGGRQEPYLYGSLGRRRVYFVPPAAQPEPAAQPGFDPRAMEHTYWTAIADSKDPSDFEEFLSRFPSSNYGPLARRNALRLIRDCTDIRLLEQMLAAHPDTGGRAVIEQRIALLKTPGADPELENAVSGASKSTLLEPPQQPMSLWQLILRRKLDIIPIGIVSALLSAITFQNKAFGFSLILGATDLKFFKPEFAPILPGGIFALALCIGLVARGTNDIRKLFLIALGSILIWTISYDIAFWTAALLSESVPGPWYVGGFIAGAFGAVAVILTLQRALLGRFNPSVLIRVAVIGAVFGSLVGLDVQLQGLSKLSLDALGLRIDIQGAGKDQLEKLIPWICFFTWQPAILLLGMAQKTAQTLSRATL